MERTIHHVATAKTMIHDTARVAQSGARARTLDQENRLTGSIILVRQRFFPDDEEDAAPFGFNGRYKTSVSLSSSAVAALISDQAGSASNSSSFLRMVVVAGARVDSAWAKPKRPGVMPKNEPPISHVVKARTISRV